MRIIGVKISIHITNFTLIVVHVPFADKSRFYVIFVLYFVVYVTIGNYYYLNTLFMYGFCCAPPLQSLFLAICTHFTLTSLPVMLHGLNVGTPTRHAIELFMVAHDTRLNTVSTHKYHILTFYIRHAI